MKEFTNANDDANKFKNRIFNALPCESLVYLIIVFEHAQSTLSCNCMWVDQIVFEKVINLIEVLS